MNSRGEFKSQKMNLAASLPTKDDTGVCLFVGCLTSQQHASVSQGWICSDNARTATLR